MQILIPMAGRGSRFEEKGYTFPKPLIDVMGKPMIQRVVENFPFQDASFHFLALEEHIDRYDLDSTLQQVVGDRRITVTPVSDVTEGAACTALLAEDVLDPFDELLIANSDQYVRFSTFNFDLLRNFSSVEGVVFAFNAIHPKWSFVRLDGQSVVEVAEKKPISNIATCGIYYYRKTEDFLRSAHRMIEKNIRTNGEFYIAPVYNELIRSGGTLIPFFVDEMFGMGTPEDLETFIMQRGRQLS
jgi:NDP-sugar pyrophosphorylase family protein